MRRGRSRCKAAAAAAAVATAPPGGRRESCSPAEQLGERAWRGGPRGPGAGGKGRSRREQEQRTNWPVPAGHERKVAAKIRASLAKRRRAAPRQPRNRAAAAAKIAETGGC
ncbi:nuclear protein 2 [Elgaria multicarinata webbii]|uniref:nuclear protein 2 n=1 Tax=Elgaria multicarinata webbii TaxID=159646 RepID=UPI002FCD2F15